MDGGRVLFGGSGALPEWDAVEFCSALSTLLATCSPGPSGAPFFGEPVIEVMCRTAFSVTVCEVEPRRSGERSRSSRKRRFADGDGFVVVTVVVFSCMNGHEGFVAAFRSEWRDLTHTHCSSR